MYQLIIRSDLDIHLKKDHNPDKEENNVIGIGSSEPEEEEEARPFAGVKIKKVEKLTQCRTKDTPPTTKKSGLLSPRKP